MLNNTNYITFVQEFSEELNRLRANPESYTPALQDKLQSLGYQKSKDTKESQIDSNDINKAIEYLQQVEPCNAVQPELALCTLAQAYAIEGGVSELNTSHFDCYTHFEVSKLGEEIVSQRPADLIVDMLHSSKDTSALFSSKFTNFGIAFGPNGNSLTLVCSSEIPFKGQEDRNCIFDEVKYMEVEACCTGKIKTAAKTAAMSVATKKIGEKIEEKKAEHKAKKARRSLGHHRAHRHGGHKRGMKEKIKDALHIGAAKKASSRSSSLSSYSSCSSCSSVRSDCSVCGK